MGARLEHWASDVKRAAVVALRGFAHAGDQAFAALVAVVSCSAAVNACELGHRWQPVLQPLAAVRPPSVAVATLSYNAAVSACELGQRWPLSQQRGQ